MITPDFIMREIILLFFIIINLVILAKIRMPLVQIVFGFFSFAVAFMIPSHYAFPWVNALIFALALVQMGDSFKSMIQ